MDTTSFEARLRAEGYPEIRTSELPPNKRNAEHAGTRTYRAGDEFCMKAGCPHVEDVGAAGVKYLVGRRPV
jgi:hypothetical protein